MMLRARPMTRLPARWACPTPAAPAWPPLPARRRPQGVQAAVPHVDGKYNVSFSGLKTAVINEVHNAEQKGQAVKCG